jgi:hypothetical protein
MKSTKFFIAARFVQGVALICLAAPLASQAPGEFPHKPTPAKIEKQIMIFPDSVVAEQWPHTLKLVNPPQNLKLLNPGQCIRVGIIATGDGRDGLLEKTQLAFHVELAGQKQDFPLAPFAGTKQLKPEGADAVQQITAAANIQIPSLSMASMGASAANWCVPADAQDGSAVIDAEIESPAGHEKLIRATIPVESFATGSQRAFKDAEELENFTIGYHYQPNPARLYPEVLFFCADNTLNSNPDQIANQAAFLSAVLKTDPTAAKDFLARVAARSGCPRALGLLGLLMGGYDIAPALQSMNEDDRQMFAQHPEMPDPYTFNSPAEVPAKFDMLWAIFCVTGQLAPMQKIATGLEWRSDWEAFDKARKSGQKFKEWTPSIGRGAAYSAAGWSISSFQQTDPLAADYIDSMIVSPDTPEAVKTELKGLLANPAFKREDKN